MYWRGPGRQWTRVELGREFGPARAEGALRLLLRRELGLAWDTSWDDVQAEVNRIFAYAFQAATAEFPAERIRRDMPEFVRLLEELHGPLPTPFSGGYTALVTRSGIRGFSLTHGYTQECRHPLGAPCRPACAEPAWLPNNDHLRVFGRSDSMIRRLARSGRLDYIEIDGARMTGRGRYIIRVQSLRDYCDSQDARRKK